MTLEYSRHMVRVRRATVADVHAMVPLINAAFAIETFLEGPRTDERSVMDMMPRGHFLVAEDDGHRIVGSVYVELGGERAYFGMLAVDPSRQRGGVGRVLIEAAEALGRAHGCACMDLDVLSLRTELLAFYRKLGYAETGIEEFRHHRPLQAGLECHRITMSKVL